MAVVLQVDFPFAGPLVNAKLIDRAPLTVAEVRPMIGLGGRHMLEQGLHATGGVPGGDFERLFREFLRHYEANIAVHSRPFPGLIEALDADDRVAEIVYPPRLADGETIITTLALPEDEAEWGGLHVMFATASGWVMYGSPDMRL